MKLLKKEIFEILGATLNTIAKQIYQFAAIIRENKEGLQEKLDDPEVKVKEAPPTIEDIEHQVKTKSNG